MRSISTRESIVRAKAAVFPVPDCDCPIMFLGLVGDNVSGQEGDQVDHNARVLEQQRQSTLLDLGRLLEPHLVDSLEQVRMP